jgi:energy-coupling factor transport system ATP-binding protein
MSLGTTLFLKGAEFRYPGASENTLSGLDLEIRAGEWVAVLGSNGSGKSTLMKLFNALLVPTQGLCFVDGKATSDTNAVQEIRSKVSLVFQNPEDQIVAAVIEEDTAFGPENLGLAPKVIQARVKDALSAVGLWEKHRSQVSSLSGGQKQRLALAGVLAMSPCCMLLDEAASMLDPSARQEFLEIVKKEHQRGVTIVQVTHRLDEIADADRAVVLKHGKLCWQGTPADLLSLQEKQLSGMGFEKTPAAKLRDTLAARGRIPSSTMPDAKNIFEALACRSK